MEELLGRKPRQLSGGQQQRVALGRALVREPQVFLLDEPLSNLDAQLRAHMRAELIELHRRIGRTMVYVTHDQLEAMTMSNRIAILKAGVLQQFATPRDIYHRPANAFVAGFIGAPAMTLIRGEISGTASDGQVRLQAGPLDLTIPGKYLSPAAGPGLVTVGVRPEDILLGSGDRTATIRVVEPTGHETIVLLDAGGTSLTARTSADLPLRAGSTVPYSLRSERFHLFDGTTGRRLNADRNEPVSQPS
jgi:multiple sugar transport system ATP-binding protein